MVDLTDLPNTQRQTQKVTQEGETKKHAPNEATFKMFLTPEKELNKMEATKIPDAEFKTMVIRMLKELRKRMDDLIENLNQERISIKKVHNSYKKAQVRNEEYNMYCICNVYI